jgi:hypothetical protein
MRENEYKRMMEEEAKRGGSMLDIYILACTGSVKAHISALACGAVRDKSTGDVVNMKILIDKK